MSRRCSRCSTPNLRLRMTPTASAVLWRAQPLLLTPPIQPAPPSVSSTSGWARALFNEPTSLAAFSELHVPVLYMMGKDSPASSRGVGRLLIRALPQVQVVEFEGMGHMGPITHPEVVNDTI